MAKQPGGRGGANGPTAGKELPQHPLVESLRPDPSQPPKKTVVLIGLPGRSDRPGYQRLYLTTKLNYYAEFLLSGILNAETLPADKSPFPGHEATQVTVGRDANIQYILAKSPEPVDEFDLDVRLGAQGAAGVPIVQTVQTCLITDCNDGTCQTCLGQATCDCPDTRQMCTPPGTLQTCAQTCQTCGAGNTCHHHCAM
jgi:hypothetical protein